MLAAAHHDRAAEAVLRAVLADGRNPDRERCGLMLLELMRVAGRRADFDHERARHAAKFPDSCPEWELPPPVQAQGAFRLRGTIGTRADDLEALPRFARERRTLVIDMGEVERVEFHFLQALQQALAAIASAGRRVIIANAGEITSTLLIAVGVERHAVVTRRKPPATPARLAA